MADIDKRALRRTLSDQLGKASIRATSARLDVLSLLCSAKQPIPPQGIHQLLSEAGIDMTLSTCYRIMAELEKAGLVEREWLTNGRVVYWSKPSRVQKQTVHRMLCRTCLRSLEVDAKLSEQLTRVAQAHELNQSGEPITVLVQCDCIKTAATAAKRSLAASRIVRAQDVDASSHD